MGSGARYCPQRGLCSASDPRRMGRWHFSHLEQQGRQCTKRPSWQAQIHTSGGRFGSARNACNQSGVTCMVAGGNWRFTGEREYSRLGSWFNKSRAIALRLRAIALSSLLKLRHISGSYRNSYSLRLNNNGR